MFERFTHEARQIVIGAQQHAAEFKHPFIGTEHLLLAMTEGPGVAAAILRDNGFDAGRVAAAIAGMAGRGAPLLDAKDAEALRSVGIDLDAVMARIEETFGAEALQAQPPAGRGWLHRGHRHGRLSPQAKKVLEFSLRETVRLKQEEIGSGQLLLGLLREGSGLAAKILRDGGADAVALRAQIEQALCSPAGTQPG